MSFTIRNKFTYDEIFDLLSFIGLLLLVLFDTRTFFIDYLPISVITSIILFLLLLIFLFQCSIIYYQKRALKFKNRTFDILIGTFLILYGLRMIDNIFIDRIYQTNFVNRYTFLVYYFFLMLLPVIMVRNIRFNYLNISRFFNILIFIFLISLIIVYIGVTKQVETHNVDPSGRFSANIMLDSIGYGHLGLTFLLLCVSQIKLNKVPRHKWLFLLLIPWGIFSMAIANARSPFVALMFILFIYILIRINYKILLLILVVGVLFVLNIDNLNNFFLSNFDSSFIERFISIFEGGENFITASGRDDYYRQGLSIFLEHPLFGNSILITEGPLRGGYVHNFFIESLMALGITGGLLFLLITLLCFWCTFSLIKRDSNYMFFALLFLQYFVYSMFSRTLLALPLYWVSCACVFSVYLIDIRNDKTQISSIEK